MENKQTSTCTSGPCERLFNAFHINSTIPIIRRLIFRQQEPSSAAVNNGRPPSPTGITSPVITNGISSTQGKKPSHLLEKNEQLLHVHPKTNNTREEYSMPTPVVGKLPPDQPDITGTISSVNVTTGVGQEKKKKVTVDPKWDKEDNTSHTTKLKKNINEKVEDYINKTKSKMRGGLGRTHASSKG